MIPILVFIGELGLISLVALVGIIPVAKNLKEFENQQVKSETFIVSIKNYVILNLGLVITIAIRN